MLVSRNTRYFEIKREVVLCKNVKEEFSESNFCYLYIYLQLWLLILLYNEIRFKIYVWHIFCYILPLIGIYKKYLRF